MKKILGLAGAAAVGMFLATAGSATTLICEGGGPGPANASDCSTVLGDFNGAVGDPTIAITDDTEIRGGIAATFDDAFTLELGATNYEVSISAVTSGSTPFVGTFTIGGTTINLDGSGTVSTLATFFDDTVSVIISATAGAGQWQINLAAVPLPASGLMLLGALGAAGFASRRRKKA